MTATSELRDGVLTIRDPWRPKGQQGNFFNACEEPTSEEILFSGSIRGGKTHGACKKLVAWAWKYGGPGYRVGVFRKTYRELEDSTKAVLLRGDGGQPPAIPRELIAYERAKDDMVVLKNGTEILFRSLENAKEAAEKIRNVTFGCMFIDQIEELDSDRQMAGEESYEALYETMCSRLSDPRGPRKMLAAANPGPTDHWVYKRFHPDSSVRQPQTRYIHVTLYDNASQLPEDYLPRMERRRIYDPLWFDRFILGKWGAYGGKRFSMFNEKQHIIDPFPIPPGWEIVEGIDYGYYAPTVVEWVAIDHYGLHYAVAEHNAEKKSIAHHAKQMRAIRAEHNLSPSSTWLDPSAWAQQREFQSVAMEFSDHGIYAAQAQNDRIGGWNRIDELLGVEDLVPDPYASPNEAGERPLIPRLRIFRDRCPELVHELPNARRKDGTDDIEKKNDHALDAFRYAINSRTPEPEMDEHPEDEDPREAYARKRLGRATEEYDDDAEIDYSY